MAGGPIYKGGIPFYKPGVRFKGNAGVFAGAGAPTNGTSGTGVGKFDLGSMYQDSTNGNVWVNQGSKASPSWSLLLPSQGLGAGVLTQLVKTVTAIADDAATTLFTITIPNPASAATWVSAMLDISIMGVAGAGGAIGAGESNTIATCTVALVRTTGAATVAAVSTLTQTAVAASSGGDQLVAVTLTLGAATGANSATQTIAVQTTLDDDTGSATNHMAVVYVGILNNGLGITVA